MNVFEDLVVELKEENLLENTVMDMKAATDQAELPFEPPSASGDASFHGPPLIEHESVALPQKVALGESGNREAELTEDVAVTECPEMDAPAVAQDVPPIGDPQEQRNDHARETPAVTKDNEFFKKRAVSEMSSFKMVEAVISSIEREHLKIIPNSYDDFEAKKALHFFLQVAQDESGDEYKQAEFNLLHQTELWCSALAARDLNITVANVRRFCETCSPALSSQAMLAIARFYRNLPYSESVRGKFDFVITRLFSRPMGNETRKLLFSREEMLGHIKTLYADWASVPLYNADTDESQSVLTTLGFEDFSNEAESIAGFDGLLKSDFFGRLRMFKESIAELFFSPAVTAAAIEANVRIGNVYVKLIENERRKMDPASIHQRFGDIDDHVVSDAVSRTLELVSILRELAKSSTEDTRHAGDESSKVDLTDTMAPVAEEPVASGQIDQVKPSLGERIKGSLYSINRWLLMGSGLLIAISVGLYVWASYYAEPQVSTAGVKLLSFQGTELGESVKIAKLSGETLYIVGQPSIDGMPKEKLTELLQKFYQAGKEKGWLNVNLMNSEGRTIGYASATRMDVYPSQ